MAKAKVELTGALSHSRGNGRVFQKGLPQIIASVEEIAYYKAISSFMVTMLEDDPPPAPAAVASGKPGKTKAKGDAEPPL